MRRIFVRRDFDNNPCAGCLSCELACAARHSLSGDVIGAMLENPTPKARIRVRQGPGGAEPLACRHCPDAPCVDACIAGAMRKDPSTGIVTNTGNGHHCIGCWMCVMACPYGAIIPAPEQEVALKCDLCPGRDTPACVEACPNEVLVFADVDEWLVNQGAAAGSWRRDKEVGV